MFALNASLAFLAVITDQQAKKTHGAISIRGRSDQDAASKRVKPVKICRNLIVRVLGMLSRRQ